MSKDSSENITLPRKAIVSLLSEVDEYFPASANPWINPWIKWGPLPEPWRVLGPGPQPWQVFGPSPEPWRIRAGFAVHQAMLAIQSIIALNEMATFMPEQFQAQMSKAVSIRLQAFIDDCGTKWPGWWRFPPPPPPPWWKEVIGDAPNSTDLVLMGSQFSSAAEMFAQHQILSRELANAGNKLTEMALQHR